MEDKDRAEPQDEIPSEIPPPVGTLFVLLTYLAILAGMWGAMYFYLLEK